MQIVILAFFLFVGGLLLHLLIWRIHPPKRQTAALFIILLGFFPLGIVAWHLLAKLSVVTAPSTWEYIHILLFHVSATLTYIIIYYSIEDRSPSMTLLTYVYDSRGLGRSRSEMAAVLADIAPVEIRLERMVRDRLLLKNGIHYRLTAKGRFWARTFAFWRTVLGMRKGG